MDAGTSSPSSARSASAGAAPVRQAVLLAGGLGSRLGSLTRVMPKPLLSVAGRPFLDAVLGELRRHGVDRVLVCAGFEGARIAHALSAEADVEVRIEPEPLGTGGALRFVLDGLDPRFLLMNGDSLFDINLWDLALADAEARAVLALREVADGSRYGAATLRGARIEAFAPQGSQGPALINGGVAVLDREVVEALQPGRALSLEHDLYPRLAAAGTLGGRVYRRPFLDIGTPEDFARAPAWLDRTLCRGAVIFDRDGVLNRDIGYAHRPEQIEWTPGALAAVKAVNDAGLFAFVATNQAGVAHGRYEEAQVVSLHAWMNDQLRRAGAHIDAFAYSPFHPEAAVERYRRDSPCRKPGPGMLDALIADFHVDRARVLMVGDRETDMAAAAGAGVEGLRFIGGDLQAVLAPHLASLAAA